MQVLERARALEQAGRSIIHLEIGEPDFTAPQAILESGQQALAQGLTKYTEALGLPALRQAIADYYQPDTRIDPQRIVVTPGSSGALQLALASLLENDDEVLLSDPGYPCNANLVRILGGQPVLIAVDASCQYQLNAQLIRDHWTQRTRVVMISSPSNPTGTLIEEVELKAIIDTVIELGGALIIDEIYHGLVYDTDVCSALTYSSQIYVVNSFSKYFGMTGWRLGWLVAPQEKMQLLNKLAQNLFISAATPAQYAALAAFEPQTARELEQRRQEFKHRRDYLLAELKALGFKIPVDPQGAFYIYADCSQFTNDSEQFTLDLLEQTGVAITPGRDFGRHQHQRYVRFSYTQPIDKLRDAISRLRQALS